jgi:exopolysaccharide biosynthesis polyprenyl glycosylphosphotransferase
VGYQLDRRAVLVGGGNPAKDLIAALSASPDIDVSIAGIFDDRANERSPGLVSGYKKLGNITELVEFVRRNRVDLLIVTLPLTAETRLLEVVKRLWVLPVDIRLSAYTQKMRYRPRAYSYIGNVPFLDVFDKPLSDWAEVVKWIEDKTLSALALLLLSPVMLIIAAAIKFDSRGPVFFKQRRFGFNNELIEVYKFRSMYVEQTDANATKLVTKGDPRVTRVGRFIRKTSLDELPQLINVLKGELSLVGPRPHATHAKAQDRLYDEAVDGYFARHRVKPASRVGRRSMAGEARQIPSRKFAGASNTISITSRTGRCFSTSISWRVPRFRSSIQRTPIERCRHRPEFEKPPGTRRARLLAQPDALAPHRIRLVCCHRTIAL